MNKFTTERNADYEDDKPINSQFTLSIIFTDDYAVIVGNLYEHLEKLLDAKKRLEKELVKKEEIITEF